MKSLAIKFCLAIAVFQLHPPSPRLGKGKSNPPQQQAQNTQQKTAVDQRGTEQLPVVIKVLPTPKSNDESTKEQQQRQDQSAANWWLVRLTGLLFIAALIQAFVFWIQAQRLTETIEKMDEIAEGQTEDMKASIAEATRAASAMETISASMATSVASVRESVEITREIADRQKLISELQSRAYLSIEFCGMVPQNRATGFRFEPRMNVVNRGNTPAYRVRFRTQADVVSLPMPEDFPFALPVTNPQGSVSIIAAGNTKIFSAALPHMYSEEDVYRIKIGIEKGIIMWGEVNYEDAFGIDRFTKFGMTFHCLEDGKTFMSNDTRHHNDSN